MRFDPTERDAAVAALAEDGGWLIDLGDCILHTQDEGTAIDLLLTLLHEDRAAATRVARAEAIARGDVVVIDRAMARSLAGMDDCGA